MTDQANCQSGTGSQSDDTDDDEIIRILSASIFKNESLAGPPSNLIIPGGSESIDSDEEKLVALLRVPPPPFIQDNCCRPMNPLFRNLLFEELLESFFFPDGQ